jgi:predicted nucleic acid-binding Zn ribbon protein
MATHSAHRNDACPCGSGKKYKKCCELKQYKGRNRRNMMLMIVVAVLMVAGIAAVITGFTSDRGDLGRPGGVWSAEHGHYH